MRRVGGLFSASAGVLRDKLLRSTSPADATAVSAPKALGASHVHQATATAALAALALFSSVAAALGNVGQASYASANAFLDALALARRSRGSAACSLQLPAVVGAGMAAA